ncbi:hypothetical protein HOLleu_38750 [Holothuria leucospilota]|uniref:Uncharacterized protein n=1 Tax=Holothuria leucospilota TaxID=206669 RepID=A0A9Q1BB81_HOLLE|nr:hypothetical protein HOLleu_38750 [Holothuria leucospilota]
MLIKSQLRVGHVSRMADHRLPRIITYGELSTGHRDRWQPKKRYKVCLRKILSTFNIDYHQWSTLAADRGTWRHTTQEAVSFEMNRRASLDDKRQKTKNSAM